MKDTGRRVEGACLRKKTNASMMTKKRSKLIFYCCMMALPILQFLLCYVYVNASSFALAFQKLDMLEGGYSFARLENFKRVFEETKNLKQMWGNSLSLALLMFVFGSLGSILFSYYIYKKKIGSGFFKIILYMPHIISTVVFVIIYQFFVELAIPEVIKTLTDKTIQGLIVNVKTQKATVIIFHIWISFGTQVLLYSSAMSGISDSMIESAQLDGVKPMRELVSIVLPMIWSTFVTFTLMRIMGIFNDQMDLYSFFGTTADASLHTFGYYLYNSVKNGDVADYPMLSAFGLLLTLIAIPVTLCARYMLNKFGPKTE